MYVPQDLQAVNGLIGYLHVCERVCRIFDSASTKTWKNEEETFFDPETIQKRKLKEK